ncbi:hypothetical protein [Acaryochloris sp. CCMEE 5410]|uniref:hypothetical protein n=1 Tax=Acaryochloris sp. CCMEE 5410 TaxID=310037 RepID=UPI0021D19340|nr:hypothetical protein [Acaryochloris sp. CCMEE 5410]
MIGHQRPHRSKFRPLTIVFAQRCSHSKSIIHPDQALKQYLSHLSIPLSKPQQQHVLRIVEGLIVGNGRKPLATCMLSGLMLQMPVQWLTFTSEYLV